MRILLVGGATLVFSVPAWEWLMNGDGSGIDLLFLLLIVAFGAGAALEGMRRLGWSPVQARSIPVASGLLEHHGSPRRSWWLGWALHGVGAAFLLAVWALPWMDLPWAWVQSLPGWAGMVFCLIVLAGWWGAMTIIRRGQQWRAWSARAAMAADPRAPILFLRSFREDGAEAEEHGLLRRYSGRVLWLARLPFSGIFHQLRLLRGVANLSFEEELGRYFARFGPFVAIGKPGETLPTLGASRLYVDHATWRAEVQSLIDRAQFIVWQAGATEGTWWELSELVRRAPARKLVLIVPSKMRPLADPSWIRKLLTSKLCVLSDQLFLPVLVPNPVQRSFAGRTNAILPRPLPALGDHRFVLFEDDWTAVSRPLLPRNALGRLWHDGVLNLHKSLALLRSRVRPTLAGPP